MENEFSWKVGVPQSDTWTLPVIDSEVPETNVFTSEDGTQTFKTEDDKDFITEG